MKILVAIKDLAIEAFGPIMQVHTTGEALRMFKDEVNNAQSRIYAHPADYEIYKLAMYDETTGEIQGMTAERIARGEDLKGEQA